jgi:16S rRNA (cytosine1402-N4)-methyltransferase
VERNPVNVEGDAESCVEWSHTSVMPEEVLALLAVRPGGRYIDGTVGSGGHSARILAALEGSGGLLGLDRDAEALRRAAARLGASPNLHLMESNYSEMKVAMKTQEWEHVDGVLLDLGTSLDQLNTPVRGFSFRQEGPLDMRMGRDADCTAGEWIRDTEEEAMARVFWELGGDSASRRIARAICARRKQTAFETTIELAEVVARSCGRPPGRIHPATRVFQAIRMVVNRELEHLRGGLSAALDALAEGGRLVVLSFHSGEDRLVKQFFAAHAGRVVSLAEGGSRWEGALPRVRLITRKAWVATPEEVLANPPSRSAKCRAVEIAHD